ncbi:MAG TPA: hypothetical protein VIP77_16185 [Jiangellaceae bacterium]
MADVFQDGNTRVYYVPTISNIQSPTTTELNAGTRLETTMTPDGLMGFEADTTQIDNSSLVSKFTTSTVGRIAYSGTALRFKKQTAVDTIFNLLVYGLSGYVAIRRGVDANTAWTAAQPCEVYPVTFGEAKRITPEPNALEKYEVPAPVTSTPATRAVVA